VRTAAHANYFLLLGLPTRRVLVSFAHSARADLPQT
jgi:hypothetical protein